MVGPMSPESVAWVINGMHERLQHEESKARGTDRAVVAGQLHAVGELWDELAHHGVAAPRPRPPQPCPQPCREDDHYLTITRWDGSMDHTVHVDRPIIERLDDRPGPEALEQYRAIARGSLLRVEPPDRPQPAREGTYVVTPPRAANVSAASVVEIIPGERMTAMDEWRARQA